MTRAPETTRPGLWNQFASIDPKLAWFWPGVLVGLPFLLLSFLLPESWLPINLMPGLAFVPSLLAASVVYTARLHLDAPNTHGPIHFLTKLFGSWVFHVVLLLLLLGGIFAPWITRLYSQPAPYMVLFAFALFFAQSLLAEIAHRARQG